MNPTRPPEHGAHVPAHAHSLQSPDVEAAREFRDLFRRFAARISVIVGSPWTFLIAILAIAAWLVTGPVFNYSNTWQLVINTGTTIITFLMVFLIQNTQNRDARAIHLKLDELIHGTKAARNRLVDLENTSDHELDQLEKEFHSVRAEAERRRAHRQARASQ